MNCLPGQGLVNVAGMAESLLQQQLDEVRGLLIRARELFGQNPIEPPQDIAPPAAGDSAP